MRITHRQMRVIVDEILEDLPEEFRAAMRKHGVAVVIHDEAPADMLDADGAGPFGAFFGPDFVDCAPASAPPEAPRIELYLRTFEEACRNRSEFEAEVEATILHELGHYLGFDEDYLDDV